MSRVCALLTWQAKRLPAAKNLRRDRNGAANGGAGVYTCRDYTKPEVGSECFVLVETELDTCKAPPISSS